MRERMKVLGQKVTTRVKDMAARVADNARYMPDSSDHSGHIFHHDHYLIHHKDFIKQHADATGDHPRGIAMQLALHAFEHSQKNPNAKRSDHVKHALDTFDEKRKNHERYLKRKATRGYASSGHLYQVALSLKEKTDAGSDT